MLHSRYSCVFVLTGFLGATVGCSAGIGRSSGQATGTTTSTAPGLGSSTGSTPPSSSTMSPVGAPPVPVDATGLTPDGVCKPPASALAVRRLTKAEYGNTVRDLLGVTESPASSFAADDDKLPYKTYALGLNVTPILAEQYSAAATKLAAEVSKQVSSLAPCAADATGAVETACAEAFIASFGKRAYRRPLAADEIARFSALFSAERARSTYAGGGSFVAEAMLQSPYFLYKSELGNGVGIDRVLTPYEVASEVSYLVTGSMPDAELFKAADANALTTPEQIEAHVRRLLKATTFAPTLRGFVEQWVGIRDVTDLISAPKDTTLFPSFDANLRASAAAEADGFVDAVLTEGNGSLTALFGANWSYANDALAQHYGLPAGSSGLTPQKVDLPVTERAGILTGAAFLASIAKPGDSFPILRGKILRTKVLCGTLAPPPANLMVQPPAPSTALTTRERFAAHSQDPVCSGCHRVIDPLGFGFENYDAVGKFRSMENGKPIDASGAIVDLAPELNGPFNGGVEFAHKIGPSQVLQQCATREFFRWAAGRLEAGTESCALGAMSRGLTTASPDIRELVVAFARTYGFTLRADR